LAPAQLVEGWARTSSSTKQSKSCTFIPDPSSAPKTAFSQKALSAFGCTETCWRQRCNESKLVERDEGRRSGAASQDRLWIHVTNKTIVTHSWTNTTPSITKNHLNRMNVPPTRTAGHLSTQHRSFAKKSFNVLRFNVQDHC